MASDKELKKIKKVYGERFMQMCHKKFPTILDHEEKLFEILQANISDISETLYEDIQKNALQERFVDFIFEKFNAPNEEKVVTDKTPYELLDEVGYDLVECHSEKEIQSFKKYYAKNEELCTFNGGRLEESIVFFAVRKDVDKIKRKDKAFETPNREDAYGTSVMSIQFNREGTTRASIISRYNHSVDNPNATFTNDLEKIAPGLTYSFEKLLKERGLKLESSKKEFGIPGYIKANDGKIYKYNSKVGRTFYCPNNIVIANGEVQKIEDPEKNFLIDYFLIDMEKKTINVCDPNCNDSFAESLKDIQKINVVKDKVGGEVIKYINIQQEGQEEPIIITLDRDNKIIGYKNDKIKEFKDGFLKYCTGIKELNTPNVEKIGNDFCPWLASEELSLPKVKKMGDRCCIFAQKLKKLETPECEEFGDECFCDVKSLEKFDLSKTKRTGKSFFSQTEALKIAEFPEIEEMGPDSLSSATSLEEVSAPKLKNIRRNFCRFAKLRSIHFPEVEEIEENCFCSNDKLEYIDLPKVNRVGDCFTSGSYHVKSVRMSNLEYAGLEFLDYDSKEIVEFEAPKISKLKWYFSSNRHVASIINRVKKEQRLNRKDIARLDKQTELIPEEIKEAKDVIEDPTVERKKENLINIEDNII